MGSFLNEPTEEDMDTEGEGCAEEDANEAV